MTCDQQDIPVHNTFIQFDTTPERVGLSGDWICMQRITVVLVLFQRWKRGPDVPKRPYGRSLKSSFVLGHHDNLALIIRVHKGPIILKKPPHEG